MKKVIVSIKYILILFLIIKWGTGYASNIEEELSLLDKDIENSTYYIEQKEKRINELKNDLRKASQNIERYVISKKIYEEYQKFNLDSTLVYAYYNYELAAKEQRIELQQESELNIIQTYLRSGQDGVAKEMLNKFVPFDEIHENVRPFYAKILIWQAFQTFLHLKNTPLAVQYKEELQKVWQKYNAYLDKSSTDILLANYLIYEENDKDKSSKLKQLLNKLPEEECDRPLWEYLLGIELMNNNNINEGIYYIIEAARHDIKLASREASAMLAVIDYVSQQPAMIERAFNYALFCNEYIHAYKDTSRSIELLKIQSVIQKGYQRSLKEHVYFMWGALFVVTVLCTIIFVLFLNIRKKGKREKHNYEKIDVMNHQLQEINDRLQRQIKQGKEMEGEITQRNILLQQEIQKRESYTVDIFYLCSDYIYELTSFRKKINAMLKNGMYNEAKKISSNSILNDEELEKLHRQFDKIFISTHPDFIKRFNKLLQDKEQIVVKNESCLTPELRIYALTCLGITDGVKIANFLHYSPQTIYNYRHKTRCAARIPEEQFEQAVKNLYAN